uniref:Uncharacterized protein n=1 Tax=Anopheles maculatus TaxID=74869 RepID=A0A182TBU4_9DIPT
MDMPRETAVIPSEDDGSERLQNGQYQHRQQNRPLIANRRSHRMVLLVAMILLMLQLIPCAKADILVYQMLNDQVRRIGEPQSENNLQGAKDNTYSLVQPRVLIF